MSEPTTEPQALSYQGSYRCPVCRHGKISALPLMEAFGCEVCGHIFTANLERQSIRVVDSSPPLNWRWTGRTWQATYREGASVGWGIWLAAAAFVTVPTAIVGLSAYLFPPLPESGLAWFPVFWTVLVSLSHLACVVWLLVEYYQFPVFAMLNNRWRWGRRPRRARMLRLR